jgi:hypothetical protein
MYLVKSSPQRKSSLDLSRDSCLSGYMLAAFLVSLTSSSIEEYIFIENLLDSCRDLDDQFIVIDEKLPEAD